jgi:hypothetical protein
MYKSHPPHGLLLLHIRAASHIPSPGSTPATTAAVRGGAAGDPTLISTLATCDDRSPRTSRNPVGDGSSTRPQPTSAGTRKQLTAARADGRRHAPPKPSRSKRNQDHAGRTAGGEILGAAIDVDDHGILWARLVADRPSRTPAPAGSDRDATELERSLTPDLTVDASRPARAPGWHSQADPRESPATQPSASTRAPASPRTAATSHRHGSQLTEPRARGSPTPNEPP